ncbi:cytochrome b/b6 domain-containing protein [Pseudooceanicola nanhaiensis]|uniref:cytochrome b/b6 domain-containing protein n=1 Tax=Pseudooceanicola nanhaiensis TaxID=375761 RepID=UPI00351437E4
MSRDGKLAAAEAHEVLKTLLLIVILGHLGAALVHRFWLRDGVLARMLPGG